MRRFEDFIMKNRAFGIACGPLRNAANGTLVLSGNARGIWMEY